MRYFAVFSAMVLFVCFQAGNAKAGITGGELEQYSQGFARVICEQNRQHQAEIRHCLRAVVGEKNPGIMLIDTFALFARDCDTNGITIRSARFFRRGESRCFFLVLGSDGERDTYTLYLEYLFSGDRRSCRLTDIYFALVYGERLREVKDFFSGKRQ